MKNPKLTLLASWVVAASLITPSFAAEGKNEMVKPDFTKGDKIPEGATHDWTLGATGMRGWIYTEGGETSDARQISVLTVDPGSPADGKFVVGDVILGVAEKLFAYDPRTELGKALTVAESTKGKGNLSLIRWRDGKQENVVIKLAVLGNYSATAPYDCPKSKRILELGCAALAKRMEDPNYEKQSAITRSLNALGLLASGDPAYLPILKKEAEWASNFTANSMATWYYGYVMMYLAEYHIATGDDSVMPGLKRIALEASNGQSNVGSWGHKFASKDGRLMGYGMMNAPGVTLTIALVLAREAGVKAPELDLAIERSLKLLRFYPGKGSIPYGDHGPWIQNHDDNGKNGMGAVLFNLVGESGASEYFSRMALACHGNERDTGHTGNFWNMTWAMPGVVQSGPNATGAWMEEYGSWYYDLARRWDGSFPHQGPAQKATDSSRGWDATGAYLLAYAMPLKKIMLTGKRPTKVPQLSAAEAKSIVIDGRGWSVKYKEKSYEAFTQEQLFERLSSWSPVVRERAAIALSKKNLDPAPIPALVKLLESDKLYTRLGACSALAQFGKTSAPAVPALQVSLKDKDLWVRVKAAEALTKIGDPAMSALADMLTMISTKLPSASDPRGMEQRFIISAVFWHMLRLIKLDGVDKDLLRKAMVAGLKNEDGAARHAIGHVYKNMNYEDIKPIVPQVLEAVKVPAPSGEMFANSVQTNGIRALSQHHIDIGIQASANYLTEQNPWQSQRRTPEILEILLNYGAAAKPAIPTLERAAATFEAGEPDFPKSMSLEKAAAVREAIEKIKASEVHPELKHVD